MGVEVAFTPLSLPFGSENSWLGGDGQIGQQGRADE
jgi:hypothetical protein